MTLNTETPYRYHIVKEYTCYYIHKYIKLLKTSLESSKILIVTNLLKRGDLLEIERGGRLLEKEKG